VRRAIDRIVAAVILVGLLWWSWRRGTKENEKGDRDPF